MGKLNSFTFITLDGYYKNAFDNTSWHQHSEEAAKFSEESLASGNTLLFGRKTYEMMAGFWPSPMAKELFPKVAESMNQADKLVISNSLSQTNWENSQLLPNDWLEEIEKRKENTNITLLGSGSILKQLAEADLIDQFQFLIDPIVIGNGSSIFKDIMNPIHFNLLDSKIFRDGSILITYSKNQ